MSAGKLPEGWVECELSELGNIVTGKTPSTKEPSNFGGNIPFIKPGDLDLGGYIMNTADTLTEKGLSLVPTLPANSVVVTCIGNLGKVGITAKKSASNQQINALIPSEKLNVKFVYYQILTLKPWLESQSAATTIAIVNKGKFSQAPFKFPPLAEQKIIAEKLDTLLAQVDSTKARLEQIPQILKRFRQAILANAVDGKLTDEWRAGKCYITEIKKISDIIQNAQVGLVRSASDQSEICTQKMRTPYIKMNNIHNVLGTNLEKIAYVSCDSYELEKYRLKNGDWLFNTRNSYELVGKSCVWNGCNNAVYNNNILRVRLKENYNSVFLDYWFHSFYGVSILNSIKSATTNVAAIYQKELLSKSVPFPPLPEQHEIVRRVEQLFAYADTIEKQVNSALARVNNLTQSILAKAFRGELTAQWRGENPDLISGENSAAALLEKIKAERAASGGKKASRKKS
ncbi:restriction endonuclease subunit S [Escherichia coli]